MTNRNTLTALLVDLIAEAKKEINAGIRASDYPADLTSIRDLADYMDVNTLGGLDLLELDTFAELVDLGNALHDALDAWLAQGRP